MSRSLGFTRVYVEGRLRDNPRARQIIETLELPVIEIERYQEIFNRGNQRFQHQKRNPALILAVKEGSLLYTGNERIRSFGDEQVRYVDQVRNCVYNCDYCFLQGMHRSAHVLMHVNGEEYREAVRKEASIRPIYLSVSYLTDLLAFERLYPFVGEWLRFAEETPAVELELRTKSDNFPAIAGYQPPPNALLVFSLSPAEIARAVERGTSAFQSRLLHARQAIRAGWRVRLCFDPILAVPEWKSVYSRAVEETFARLPAEQVEEVSLGVFRIHPDYMKRMQKERTDVPLLFHPFQKDARLLSYESELREEMVSYVEGCIRAHMPRERITTVHG